jgi:hypothetical protein
MRKDLNKIFWMAAWIGINTATFASAADSPNSSPAGENEPSASSQQHTSAPKSDKERNFYEVLDDVLGDFEYDLKNGNVTGMSQLSIRNIALSENVPPSFKSHLELLITERILKITKTKVIQCLPCRAKKAQVSGDQVIITSPDTNPAEMARIAKNAGIANFMDVAFTFQSSGIVLSMTVTDPETGSVIWSRNYNSEASRAAAFRRGVDYSQTDDARKFTEYQPQVQYRAIVYYLMEPNVNGTTGTLGLGYRMVERYDNRKKEVGFEVDYLKDSSTLVGSSSSSSAKTVNLYDGLNLTLLFLHGWNLIGSEENYNQVRTSINFGVGGTYSSGFLGALIRTQFEWRLGKHYTVSLTGGYRPTATAFLNSSSAGKVAGAEFGLGINLLY